MLIKLTVDTIAAKIDEYFKAPLRGDKKRDRDYLLDYGDRTKDLALLVLNVVIAEISKDGYIKTLSLATKINNALHKNYIMERLKEQHPKLYSYIEREFKTRGKGYIASRKMKLGRMKAELDDIVLSRDTARVATVLIDIVIKSGCNIIEKEILYKKGKKHTVLKYTDEAFNLIIKNREAIALTYRKYPIFVVPPVDWSQLDGSLGYYNDKLYRGSVIKTRGKNKKLLQSYTSKKPMDRYLNILNKIQSTKWRINKRVYDVLDEVLTENIVDYECPLTNPYLIGGIPYNRKQTAEDYVNVYDYGDVHEEGKHIGMPKDRQQYKEWYKATEIQKEKILINRSKAITLNLAMLDAKQYLNEPSIYFSYQSDFRGRIYPVQQHLNPQMKGEVRALLEFGDGVPIENDYQLNWFKIHGANTYGYDKLPYVERISKIDEMTIKIKLIANDPIRYQEHWKDSDNPYGFLAWCFEYNDYLTDKEHFRSHIPIGLDATCSGIQIYSGLLKDGEGAKAVNVIGQTREDIYQKVADKVNFYLANGYYSSEISFKKSDGTINVCSTQAEADSMKGKVSRRLTKRNTMTQPYSVTTYGMYQQLLEELDDMEDKNEVIWRGDKWVLARLLTELNDKAIVETVEGARIGQEFLKDVTRRVTARGDYIFFTTPILEFPVLQKIHKLKSQRIRTELGQLHLAVETNDIHNMKMVNGIAPNFIHSLDFTLMFLTVEKLTECKSFHLVHDEYGVPINQVGALNKEVRESYIELFEANPLHRFTKQVCDDMVEGADEKMINTLDLNEVRNSEYIFS